MFNAPYWQKIIKYMCLICGDMATLEAPFMARGLQGYQKDLKEFIDAHFKTEINLVAYSMGCTVVWSYIDLFDRISSAGWYSLMSPILCGQIRQTAKKKCSCMAETGWISGNYEMRSMKKNGDRKPRLVKRSGGGENKNRKEAANTISQVVKPPFHKQFLANLLRDHISQDWRDVFPRITVPVLLVSGEIGHATTHESCEWMQKQMKNCKMDCIYRKRLRNAWVNA